MKTKHTHTLRFFAGGVIAALGLAVAVMVADGSKFEILARFGGIAIFVVGAWIADLFDDEVKGLIKK